MVAILVTATTAMNEFKKSSHTNTLVTIYYRSFDNWRLFHQPTPTPTSPQQKSNKKIKSLTYWKLRTTAHCYDMVSYEGISKRKRKSNHCRPLPLRRRRRWVRKERKALNKIGSGEDEKDEKIQRSRRRRYTGLCRVGEGYWVHLYKILCPFIKRRVGTIILNILSKPLM